MTSKLKLVVLVVLTLVGLGLFYVVNLTTIKKPVFKGDVVTNIAPESKLVKVDFAYQVKSITAGAIVLTGKNGEFTLPNDASKVEVYNGPTKESVKISLADLKVGNNLNMEFVPGKSASLFVLGI